MMLFVEKLESDGLTCPLSHKTIARECGLSQSRAKVVLRGLRERGVIEDSNTRGRSDKFPDRNNVPGVELRYRVRDAGRTETETKAWQRRCETEEDFAKWLARCAAPGEMKTWKPRADVANKKLPKTRTLRTHTRDGVAHIAIPGKGMLKLKARQELRIAAEGDDLAAVTIAGADMSSLRIPETADVKVAAGLRLEPEQRRAQKVHGSRAAHPAPVPARDAEHGSQAVHVADAQPVRGRDSAQVADRLAKSDLVITADEIRQVAPGLARKYGLPDDWPLEMFVSWATNVRAAVKHPTTHSAPPLLLAELAEAVAETARECNKLSLGTNVPPPRLIAEKVLEQAISGSFYKLAPVKDVERLMRIADQGAPRVDRVQRNNDGKRGGNAYDRSHRNLEAAGFEPAAMIDITPIDVTPASDLERLLRASVEHVELGKIIADNTARLAELGNKSRERAALQAEIERLGEQRREIEAKCKGALECGPAGNWDAILPELEHRINPHSFATWFRPARELVTHDGVTVVVVPTNLFVKRLRDTYGKDIRAALASIGKAELRCEFVSAESERQAA